MADGDARRINTKSEDDGYVVGLVTNGNSGASEAQIIDAQNFGAGPVARLRILARVPTGFHRTRAR